MGRPYSTDLRERVLRACENGEESQAEIARRFEISEAHPGLQGAGSGVRRPGRRPRRRGELFPFYARYGRIERTQDRSGVSPGRCHDEVAARSAAMTST